MTMLIIHTPDNKVKGGAKSFEAVLEDGLGVGYAIFLGDISRLTPGVKVVLLRKDKRKRRAEGILNRLIPTNIYTSQGIRRYDVKINGLAEVTYKPEPLNRFGVAII